MPTGVVVIVTDFHQTQRAVVIGSHPLDGINDSGLHRRINFATRNPDGGPARRIENLTGEARDAHFQSL